MKKGILKSFKSPIKGAIDIILVLGLTALSVFFFGRVVIQSPHEGLREEIHCPYTDFMGRTILDYLLDGESNVIGTLHIEYHDNGSFRRIVERNEAERTGRIVYYSEENEFLYWYEVYFDEFWAEVERQRFDSEGRLLG